ncbi:hypothetical protein ASPTUDRAFT_137506, partial [Aspergillus tubingensis CBS 134.48]
AKIEFIKDNINKFINTIAGYKLIILVELETIIISVIRFCFFYFINIFHEDILPRYYRKFLKSIMR